jgi:cation transporter-like permease
MFDGISGVGGNLVAVQASRLSTALHKESHPGNLPAHAVHGCPSPLKTFFGKGLWFFFSVLFVSSASGCYNSNFKLYFKLCK